MVYVIKSQALILIFSVIEWDPCLKHPAANQRAVCLRKSTWSPELDKLLFHRTTFTWKEQLRDAVLSFRLGCLADDLQNR